MPKKVFSIKLHLRSIDSFNEYIFEAQATDDFLDSLITFILMCHSFGKCLFSSHAYFWASAYDWEYTVFAIGCKVSRTNSQKYSAL